MRLPRTRCVERLTYIVKECKGKSVLHLGCTYSPETKERFESGHLLHLHIQKVAKELYGIDLDADSITYLKEKGIPNLYVGDVEHLQDLNLYKTFDMVVAGEIIDHLSNPGLFLKGITPLLAPDGILIITVENPFAIKRIPQLIWRNEATPSDHTIYFTYSTLSVLLSRAGFVIEEFCVYYYGKEHPTQRTIPKIARHLLKRLPLFHYLADGLVLEAKYDLR